MLCGTRWLHRSLIRSRAGKASISWSREARKAAQSAVRRMTMRGAAYGEAWNFILTRNYLVFKLKGFEVSIQWLVCITLLGLIAFLCGAANENNAGMWVTAVFYQIVKDDLENAASFMSINSHPLFHTYWPLLRVLAIQHLNNYLTFKCSINYLFYSL